MKISFYKTAAGFNFNGPLMTSQLNCGDPFMFSLSKSTQKSQFSYYTSRSGHCTGYQWNLPSMNRLHSLSNNLPTCTKFSNRPFEILFNTRPVFIRWVWDVLSTVNVSFCFFSLLFLFAVFFVLKPIISFNLRFYLISFIYLIPSVLLNSFFL